MVKREISIGADERVISNDEYRTLATTTKVIEIKKVENVKMFPAFEKIIQKFDKNNPEFLWFILMEIFVYLSTPERWCVSVTFFVAAMYCFFKTISVSTEKNSITTVENKDDFNKGE